MCTATHTSYSPFRPHVAETGHVVVQLISFRLNQANASVCFFLEYSMSNMLRDAIHGHPPGLKAPIIIIINGRDVFNLEFRSTHCKLDGTRSKGREERKEYLKHFNVIIFSDSGNAVWHPHGNYGLQMAGSEIEEYKSIQMSLTI